MFSLTIQKINKLAILKWVFTLSMWTIGNTTFVKAQKTPKSLHSIEHFHKNFVKINKNTYACKYETTNADYVRFITNVKTRMNPSVYTSLLPDTNRWNDPGMQKPEWVKVYLRGPKFALYPVVNINYEQANFYCAWLTSEYERNPNKPFKKAVFKLPTKSEWQQAMSMGDMKNLYPWGDTLSAKPKKIKVNDSELIKKNKPNFPVQVNKNRFRQTPHGIYHAAGNVSEMVSSKGDCIGGNYRSHPYFRRIDVPNEFYPSYFACPLVGFRVFFQVLEE
ncbi:MAG: formylglycine-generating enzyme family protein [Bacteroidia bacterium]|nr:formylglycine-generating enzyme family protein [Bacteroidia bacterium]